VLKAKIASCSVVPVCDDIGGLVASCAFAFEDRVDQRPIAVSVLLFKSTFIRCPFNSHRFVELRIAVCCAMVALRRRVCLLRMWLFHRCLKTCNQPSLNTHKHYNTSLSIPFFAHFNTFSLSINISSIQIQNLACLEPLAVILEIS